MASIWNTLAGSLTRKSASPDWGTLERYMAWAFGGGAAASGIVVNPQTAMQSSAVYACNKVLAESIGMLPINVYRLEKSGARTLLRDHPLQALLNRSPNDWQTTVEFLEMAATSLNLRGNAFAYINRAASGRVVELLPLHPDMVRVNMGANWQMDYQITMPDGSFNNYATGQILHIRGLTLNGWMGISPIAYARESIGLALATEKYGSQLFRNGAKMGGVLEHPGKLGKESYERLKNSFDDAYSGENAHKTALLEEGMKFSKITMSADDSQFLETRKYQRSEIAATFRVPPHMIGDLEKATFSNIEQLSLEFVTYSLMPWLVRIEKALERDLLTPAERTNLCIKFNVSGLLRGDAAARSELYASGITNGWMTRNEARMAESDLGIVYNPIDGLDTPLMPLNMTDGTQDIDAEQDESQGVNDLDQTAPKPSAKSDQKALSVAQPEQPQIHMPINIHLPGTTVQNLLPEQQKTLAPVVHVNNQVQTPEVTVNVEALMPSAPANAPPVVHVTNQVQPAPVTVNNAFAARATQTVQTDPTTGDIVRTVTDYS